MAVVALLIGAGPGFEYEYATAGGKVPDLNQAVSSQRQQISSLNSMVPDSEIFGVQSALTLYSRVNGSIDTGAYHTIWDIGLPYHAGCNITLYVDASQLFNYTGLMNIAYIGQGPRGSAYPVSPLACRRPQILA